MKIFLIEFSYDLVFSEEIMRWSSITIFQSSGVLDVLFWASLVAQTVKRLPAMQETWVRSLGQEDPLEKEMATHSSTLAWRIPWAEEPGGLRSTGSQSRTGLSDFTSLA